MTDNTNTEALLPCARCGGKAIVKRNKTVLVQCSVCSASTFQLFDDPESAIVAWNRRSALTNVELERETLPPLDPETKKLINDNPVIQSLLYALNLLPECCRSIGDFYHMQSVVGHFHNVLHPSVPAPIDDTAEYELWQGDEVVAETSGPRAMALTEICCYAALYSKDGPIQVFQITRKEIDLDALTNTGEQG